MDPIEYICVGARNMYTVELFRCTALVRYVYYYYACTVYNFYISPFHHTIVLYTSYSCVYRAVLQ